MFPLKMFQWHGVCGPIHGHQRRPPQTHHLCFCSNYSEWLVLLHIQPSNQVVAQVQVCASLFLECPPFSLQWLHIHMRHTHVIHPPTWLLPLTWLPTGQSLCIYIYSISSSINFSGKLSFMLSDWIMFPPLLNPCYLQTDIWRLTLTSQSLLGQGLCFIHLYPWCIHGRHSINIWMKQFTSQKLSICSECPWYCQLKLHLWLHKTLKLRYKTNYIPWKSVIVVSKNLTDYLVFLKAS